VLHADGVRRGAEAPNLDLDAFMAQRRHREKAFPLDRLSRLLSDRA
jgi:hypothetical protein